MDLSVKQRKQIGLAINKLRTIYEIQSITIARKVKYSQCHQLHIESGTVPVSDTGINRYCDYFKLDIDSLLRIGNCQTLIDVFKYLQGMGRI